jgi:L-threonylcarbamoyladenylate synthase
VALRVPAHPLAQKVLQAFRGGLAAPSANRFGKISPTTAEHVRADLGSEVDYILDGGPCEVGVESTIIDLSRGKPEVLRPGGLALERISEVLGHEVPVREHSEVRVSGALPSHYAPRAGLLLVDEVEVPSRAAALAGQGQKVAVLVTQDVSVEPGIRVYLLPADPAGYARGLYARLREIDEKGFDVIVAAQPESGGLGTAVRDRLRRAAAPRGGH